MVRSPQLARHRRGDGFSFVPRSRHNEHDMSHLVWLLPNLLRLEFIFMAAKSMLVRIGGPLLSNFFQCPSVDWLNSVRMVSTAVARLSFKRRALAVAN